MTAEALLVNAAGLVLIGLIVWWFWLSRPPVRQAAADQPIEILVADGVYTPARIEVAAGRPVRLRFLRKDPSACAQKVVFAGLDVARELPLGVPQDVTLTPQPPGEYEFTCEMAMYRGSLVVK